MFANLQPLLDPMSAAQNEKDFHAALEPIIAMAGPLLAQLPGLMRRQQGGGYGGDYGDGYDDMDMDMGMEEEMMQEQMMMEQEMRNGGN
jgi:hypothetical protein